MVTDPGQEIFALPIAGKVLLYAPLLDLVALVDASAAERLRQDLSGAADTGNEGGTFPPALAELRSALRGSGWEIPQPRQGGMGLPLFLGLVTTRGCNMGCVYCDFAAPKQTSPVMDISVARDAVDVYFDLLAQHGSSHAELHFFGGEPFFAPRTMHFVVEYARAKAAEKGLTIRLEAITNGLFNRRMSEWAAGVFDTIFLSLDGPQSIQDRYRPALGGRSAFDVVAENARIFSETEVELILRSCITSETVSQMPEIAAWFAENFRPSRVCFEVMSPSTLSTTAQLEPPDPWIFAQKYDQAADILAAQGIESVMSTAELTMPHVTFCPVGKDAMIVTPDGAVHACYLLEDDWRKAGLDLTFGQLNPDGRADGPFSLDPAAVERIRQLNVHHYPLCADCFCRYHCSGGCHVNRREVLQGSTYDATCIQTRIISASTLLKRMGQADVNRQWLADPALTRAAVLQQGDRLL